MFHKFIPLSATFGLFCSPAVKAEESTEFFATTKLTGVVRFVIGSGFRGAGYANFAQAAALTETNNLYGHRVYDGSVDAIQNRFINRIDSPLSQGEAFIYYRANAPQFLSRELAFSTSWTGYIPNNIITAANNSINAFAEPANLNVMQGVGAGQNLILNGPNKKILAEANLTRLSLFTDSGFRQAVNLPSSSFTLEFLLPATNINQPLQADQIALQDRYGRSNVLFATTSGSSSSEFNSSRILLDRKDMQALLTLANQARRVKNYSFLSSCGDVINKPSGVVDPIVIAEASQRNYLAVNPAGLNIDNFGAAGTGLVVTPGGLVTNPTIYNNIINYLIAEYGSLSEQQRSVNYVHNAASKFIRNLAAYPTNKNYVADKNALTFSHDAFLNFNTSFHGQDQLLFRLRSNNIYSFAARSALPAAALAYDGAIIDWPNGDTPSIFVDRFFYSLPLTNKLLLSIGARIGQDAILPSRASFYNQSALLEFFSSAAGVIPSYTGSGAGLTYGPFAIDFLGLKDLRFGVGYLVNEADAVAPDQNNIMVQGLFGADTRFRVPLQLAWQSVDARWLLSANYAYERGNNSIGSVGTALALNPFMYPSLNQSNQFGFSLAHQLNDNFSISAAYGFAFINARYSSSVLGVEMTKAGDKATLNSWMLAFNFNNIFSNSDAAGIGIGAVPALLSNSSQWSIDSTNPIALETWYQFQLTDYLSISPGVFYISGVSNPDGIGAGGSWGGVIKTQLNF
jgi:hypothetical protein